MYLYDGDSVGVAFDGVAEIPIETPGNAVVLIAENGKARSYVRSSPTERVFSVVTSPMTSTMFDALYAHVSVFDFAGFVHWWYPDANSATGTVYRVRVMSFDSRKAGLFYFVTMKLREEITL